MSNSMRPPTAEHAHLAGAFLALTDDPQPAAATRRSPAGALCAVAAGLVLAFAAPLTWAVPGKPRDLPAATAGGKAGVIADDDEDDRDGDPDGAGGTWAATDA